MRVLRSLLLVLLLGLVVYAPAYAVPTLSFSVDGGAAVTCADQAACDTNVTVGVVTYNAPVGPFDVNVTTGVTKPVLPGSHMDLAFLQIQTTDANPHTLEVLFSEIDYTLLNVAGVGTIGGTVTNNGSTVTASAYYDETNTLFGLTSLIGTTGPLSGPAFSASFSGGGPTVSPYSLTQALLVSTTGPLTLSSGDFELNMVPEPASVALLGGVLLLTMSAIRRKFRRT